MLSVVLYFVENVGLADDGEDVYLVLFFLKDLFRVSVFVAGAQSATVCKLA